MAQSAYSWHYKQKYFSSSKERETQKNWFQEEKRFLENWEAEQIDMYTLFFYKNQ